MPEMFARRNDKGELYFAVPGYDVTSYDYLLEAQQAPGAADRRGQHDELRELRGRAVHRRPLQRHRVRHRPLSRGRGDARIKNWADWVANAKFRQIRVDARAPRTGSRGTVTRDEGKAERLARSYVARMALQRDDVRERHRRVRARRRTRCRRRRSRARTSARAASTASRRSSRFRASPCRPARPTSMYEPVYALNDGQDGLRLRAAARARRRRSCRIRCRSRITFFAGQGEEPTLIKIGTAYESATHHRFAPPDFGPVSAQPEKIELSQLR